MAEHVESPSETLDFRDLLKRLDSDLDFLDEVVGMFQTEYPTLLANLDKGIAVDDFVLAERAAHTLKGMLGNLSMAEARATASRIEMAARAKSKAETVEAVPPLRGQVAKALELLDECRTAARV